MTCPGGGMDDAVGGATSRGLLAEQGTPRHGLASWTTRNLNARDPENYLVVTKPSGAILEQSTPDIVVVKDIEGAVVDGTLRPSSSDEISHLSVLPNVGGSVRL